MRKEALSMPVIDEGRYRGQWLALDPVTHEIVAHGAGLKEVVESARKLGYEEPIFHAVPESDIHLVTIE